MKRLFLILLIFFMINPFLHVNAQTVDFRLKFTSTLVTPKRDETEIQMFWYTEDKMTSLKVVVFLDGIEEHPVSWEQGPDGKHNPNWDPPLNPGPDGRYRYHLTFTIESGKYGVLELNMSYSRENDPEVYELFGFITTNNPNVVSEFYSPTAAIIIGIMATLGAALGTYLIYLISQKEIFDQGSEESSDEVTQ